jgi:hypothetical protein
LNREIGGIFDTEKFFANKKGYSALKLRTGLATAAFTACPLTTAIVISRAPRAVPAKTHHGIPE